MNQWSKLYTPVLHSTISKRRSYNKILGCSNLATHPFIYPLDWLPLRKTKPVFPFSIYPWVDEGFPLKSLYPVGSDDVNSISLLHLPICPSTHHDEERKWVDLIFLFHLPMGRWQFSLKILVSSVWKWCQLDFSASSTHLPIYPSWWRKEMSWLVFPVPSTHG